MLFIDANVFLHAVGGDSPWRQACADIVLRVGAGTLAATTSAEVLQEVLHVCRRKGRAEQGVRLVRDLVDVFGEMPKVGRSELVLALRYVERHPRLSTRDAVHVATLLLSGCRGIVTVDGDFAGLEGVTVVAPDEVGGW